MRISTEAALVSDGMIRGHLAMFKPYARTLAGALNDHAYTSPESALAAPSDERVIREAGELASRFAGVRTVLLCGIGGSDLGTRAVYDALYGHTEHFAGVHHPTLLTLGAVEPHVLAAVKTRIAALERPEDVVLVVVSKSGTTTETLANAAVVYDVLKERFGAEAAAGRCVVIGNDGTELARTARSQGMTFVSMPKQIGGRYSVFTSVGLVPLALLGVDVRAFAEGGRRAAAASAPDSGVSSAAVVAATLFEAYLTGTGIHELFMWNPELETLGKWYRQLLAESIGKHRGDDRPVGIMPTVAIGSTDLHSLGQLVFGGPKNRCTTFVAAPNAWQTSVACPADGPFTNTLLAQKPSGTVTRAIYEAVQATYEAHGLPFMRIELEGVQERELGAFMAMQMASVMYLARLFDVNAFDQPNVEAYKSEVRRLLTNS